MRPHSFHYWSASPWAGSSPDPPEIATRSALTRACSRQAGWAGAPCGRDGPDGQAEEALICVGGKMIACS